MGTRKKGVEIVDFEAYFKSQGSSARNIREFKQIATAGADTAAGSKFPQK